MQKVPSKQMLSKVQQQHLPRTDHILCRALLSFPNTHFPVFCHLLFPAGRNNSSMQHFSSVWCRIFQRQLELLLFFAERVLERWLNQINLKELVPCPEPFQELLLGRSWDKEPETTWCRLEDQKVSPLGLMGQNFFVLNPWKVSWIWWELSCWFPPSKS